MTATMSEISALPVDLWLSIFQNLHAETLGICMCVCKQWRSILSSPYFINYHLNHIKSSSTSSNPRRLQFVKYPDGHCYSILQDNNQKSRPPPSLQLSNNCMVAFPFSRKEFNNIVHHFVIGISGGIYCLHILQEDHDFYYLNVILWNPTIRKCMVLSRINLDALLCDGFYVALEGFGFESSLNDYKFVMVSGFNCFNDKWKPGLPPPVAHVYSLARGTWRSFRLSLPHQIVGSGVRGACADGVIYWKIYTQEFDHASDNHDYGKVILTFDIRDEVFGEIELPEDIIDELEEDMDNGRGMFQPSCEYLESLVLWDKEAKPTSWSKAVRVIETEELDLELV